MSRSNCLWLTWCSLAVVLMPATVTGQMSVKAPAMYAAAYYKLPTSLAAANGMTCKVYALAEMSADPNLCKWVADTIPQVIEPGTWGQDGAGQRRLSYFPPGKVLVIYHTAAVHAKVEEFVGSLKKAMTTARNQSHTAPGQSLAPAQAVVPAQYAAPAAFKAGDPAPVTPSYPVASPIQQPRHLFHFIIRYEGEGIIDSNVVEFMKAQTGQKWTSPVTSQHVPACAPSPAMIPPSARTGGPTGSSNKTVPMQPGSNFGPPTPYANPTYVPAGPGTTPGKVTAY